MNVWDKVAKDFGKKGPKYWNLFGEELVEYAEIEVGAKVLDIGMGRGASLFPALKMIKDTGEVTCIDSSYEMVRYTKASLKRKGINNARVLHMNAKEMDFSHEYFNYIISGFGLPFIESCDEGLMKTKAILKKGGKVAFSLWGEQQDQKWFTKIVDKYLKKKVLLVQ